MHRAVRRAVVVTVTLAWLLSLVNAAQLAQMSADEVTVYSSSGKFIDTRAASEDLPDFAGGETILSAAPVHDGVLAQKTRPALRAWLNPHFIRGPPAWQPPQAVGKVPA